MVCGRIDPPRTTSTQPPPPHQKKHQETILTGSSDGLIRLCAVQPNKLLGVLGSHDDFPVERMAFSHDRRLLASIAHDSAVRLWDVTWVNWCGGGGRGDGLVVVN